MRGAVSFAYEKTIGCWGRIAHPVDVTASDSTGVMYVLNRSTAWNAPHGRAVGVLAIDAAENVACEFGRLGTDPGQLFMPTAITIGPDRRVFVADEHLNAISVFDEDGTFIERWGRGGSAPGEFSRPSGLAFDSRGRLFVVDHANARVQCFAPDGEFIDTFGRPGIAPGEFRLPWAITIDAHDRIWIADWGNDRIQALSLDGRCEMVIGGTAGDGAVFRRPAAVAIDDRDYLFVSDWGNDRVLIFDEASSHVATWYGDSVLSTWAVQRIKEFPVFDEQRQASGLYEQERRFWRPAGLRALPSGHVLVVDSCRHRIQVYRRSASSLESSS